MDDRQKEIALDGSPRARNAQEQCAFRYRAIPADGVTHGAVYFCLLREGHDGEHETALRNFPPDTCPSRAVPDEEPTRHSPSSNDDLTINCPKCGYTQTLGELRASHRCGNCGHSTRSLAQLEGEARRAELASLSEQLSALRSESEALRRDKDAWEAFAHHLARCVDCCNMTYAHCDEGSRLFEATNASRSPVVIEGTAND